MRLIVLRAALLLCLSGALAKPAPRSSPSALHERLICVVPMIGSGTIEDPKRPMFAPVAEGANNPDGQRSKGFAEPPSIVGYHMVMADDGQTAIVEFLARDRAAFKVMLESQDPSIRVLDPHRLSGDKLLRELRVFKKNFTLSAFAEGGL